MSSATSSSDANASESSPGLSASARNAILFGLFFVSGFCGLAYQVVWLRLAYASFGVITPVMSVVISVFMLGLGAGSWIAGRGIARWTRRSGRSAIDFYGAAELLIAAGAFAVPPLFQLGQAWLLPLEDMGSASYLLLSAPLLGLSILPWCLAMGATYPLVLGFVREVDRGDATRFSFLYFANTVGAMAGVLVTAIVLIELLGFRATLWVCAALNVGIALTAFALGRIHRTQRQTLDEPGVAGAGSLATPGDNALGILFTTGFCAMAFEVIWVRAFTPVLGTLVYSFALLLFTYLLATWLGALLYRVDLGRQRVISTGRLVAVATVTAFLPILFNDPRILSRWWETLLSIAPLCAVLGYLTPKLVDDYSRGHPEAAGRSYAINVLGSILGPLCAAYIVLPLAGARLGMVLLGLPFLGLLALRWRDASLAGAWRIVTAGGALALLLSALFLNVSFEEGPLQVDSQVRRDHTATVVSYGEGMEKHLEVNGVGITKLASVAKVMGHMPLSFLDREPKSALVICFGMGTTYRSLMSWGIEATAVELAPSVVAAFPYYFDDARTLLEDPRGRVNVDDGRRFLQRAGERFDVITIDPPPPVEAAGSSLLYSRDFYDLVKRRLAPGGVLHHWYPGREGLILSAVTRALADSFPYLRAYRSFDGRGVHFIAAMEPFEVPSAELFVERAPGAARADLTEWGDVPGRGPIEFARDILSREVPVEKLLHPDPRVVITDDRPFNEYYVLRRLFPGMWQRAVPAGRSQAAAAPQ